MDERIFTRYFQAVSLPDAFLAVETVDEALTNGEPPAGLITDVLARAQRTAGEKWMSGEWTVADEHAATSVTDQALTVVAPPRPKSRTGLHVVVACAEGEWHTLPARMAGELLRGDDLDVSILGPSIPVDHLRRHLSSTAPDVLALSATMPVNLIGAARSIAAAREEGIPVVVGGAAWGQGQQRARALGAHLRLDDPREIPDLLDELRALEPPPLAEIPAEARWLDDLPQEFVLAAFGRQCADNAWMARMDERQRTESQKDLRWIARYTAAALACDDPTVVAELLDWLLALLVPRGVPAGPVVDSAGYLADAVEAEAPNGAALLRQEVVAAHERIAAGNLPDARDDDLVG